jgi:signal transduction histidine kinase
MSSLQGSDISKMAIQRFCSEIPLVPLIENPHGIFSSVCRLWLDATGADWIWLWSKNEFANKFQLSEVYPVEYYDQPIPNSIGIDSECIASLALRCGIPQRITDFSKVLKFGGVDYTIQSSKLLQDLGCEGFITVPLGLPAEYSGIEKDEEQLDFEGAICLHYKDLKRFYNAPSDNDLLTMARLSRSRIVDAYQAEFFRILVELNNLSRRFVPRYARSPDIDRVDYLQEVSKVIKRSLRTQAVSFFYRQPYEDAVTCLYTDGIVKPDGTKVQRSQLSDVRYELGESKTGECFRLGTPRVVLVEHREIDQGKYYECTPEGHKVDGPTLLCPVPRSSERIPRADGPMADGVIRCAGHPERFLRREHTNFDSMDVRTVQFIAEQISPVLDLLAMRRQREWQVSVIKHDLEIPITMISDTVGKLVARGQISASAGYAPDDIQVACHLLTYLTNQLDFEASRIRVEKKPTRLLGDIIARSIQMLRHFAAQENEMKVVYEGFDEIPVLMIDPMLTERVIHNLVMNAVKYGHEGSLIRIGAGKSDNCYYIDVENHGLGIRPEEEKLLFRRYYRSKRAKKRRHGVGIGLYMAKTIMELQKGELFLQQGDGPTIFRITFPRSAKLPD